MAVVVRNPYDESVVCELASDHASRDEILTGLVAAQQAWRQVPLAERVAAIESALELFRTEREAIARDVTRQMGKPIREALGEVDTCLTRGRHMLSIAVASLQDEVLPELPGIDRRIRHEPLGVVLNLVAWNYPLLIPINVVIPALAAGNAIAIKHSDKTPLCATLFERAFGGIGPGGLVKSLVLSHEETAEWITDPRIGGVAFTGSVAGGLAVQQAARERFVGVGLELGGKDPAYVAEDADLDFAVPNIVEGACYNAGQSCCAVERVYVHASLYEEFLARAEEAAKGFVLGDPLREETTLGPMASLAALETLEAHVASAVAGGARLICGGARVEERFFPPTILADCPQDCLAMQEESFGPLIAVQRVDDDAQALERMNDSRFGLTASVWTRDPARAEWFAERLEAGTVFQNRCDYLDPALPWTGWKESGRGVSLSRYGLLHLTRRKGLHLRR
ncbi:MAG: aldehyde dehydrogenase family protein [Planctomycetes bacterium]|nr:aldehyde dehydrogenase family protein [Planctomycetota bacterium]